MISSGRQGQGHQGGDPVAGLQAQRRLRPHLVDDADQHAAGARDRVLHLAASRDDLEHLPAYGRAVAVVLGGELAERRGVQVEPLDPQPHLVRADRRGGVQPLGGLRQGAGRGQHAVQAHRRGGHEAVLPVRGRSGGNPTVWRWYDRNISRTLATRREKHALFPRPTTVPPA